MLRKVPGKPLNGAMPVILGVFQSVTFISKLENEIYSNQVRK